MSSHALLTDDLATLLSQFPNDALRNVRGLMIETTSYSPLPTDRACGAAGPRIRTTLMDPELSQRRTDADVADTTRLVTAGTALHHDQYWMRGRAVMIDAGLISADPSAAEFETVCEIDGLVFETIGQPARA